MNRLAWTGLLLGGIFLGACSPATQQTQPQQQTAQATNSDPLEIKLTRELESSIQAGPVPRRSVAGRLEVAGRVEADETRLARVSAPVTGRITEIHFIEGQAVKRGDVMATIYSTELSSAQSGFLKAISQQDVARRAMSRAKQLLEADVISQAEVQKREAEFQQATADVAASREQLGVLGLSADDIKRLQDTRAVNSVTRILATIDGIVLDRKATIGQVVQAVEVVFVIADLSEVWLVADVPEQSVNLLGVGKVVEAEIPAVSKAKVSGKLSFVSAVVNPETRTVRTRMELANPKRLYKPSMLTTMTLLDSAEQRLVVPNAAVVRENNADHVFVETAPGVYRLKPVTLGEDRGDMRIVMEGLEEGQKIITSGAFHLNNERKRRALSSASGE